MSPVNSNRRNPVTAGFLFILFILWSLAIIFSWIVHRPFLRNKKYYKSRIASHYARWWSLGMLKLLGLKVKVHGSLPSPPFFLVTNHLGYLDIAILASQIPSTFVSKSEVARWPIFGTLASFAGTLYVDRKSKRDSLHMGNKIAEHFSSGGSLTLFPEGTSTAGNEVAPFHSSLLQYPASVCYPVNCAALKYKAPEGFPEAGQSMAWWGDMAFLPHFWNLFRMRGMQADIAFAVEPVVAGERKTLAEQLRHSIQERFEFIRP